MPHRSKVYPFNKEAAFGKHRQKTGKTSHVFPFMDEFITVISAVGTMRFVYDYIK